jgi:UDP-MurNAc hydroxylase
VSDGKIFFDDVVEMPHGRTLQLGGGLEITSYQNGLMMDTALAVSDGRTTLVDLNDCKITGRPLRQVMKNHPSIDFVFRSHSSASAYPWCVTTEDPNALAYRTNEDYKRDFVNAARLLGARYAVPFASAHCFLHKDTRQFNQTVVSPNDVKAYFDAHKPRGSECAVMVAGDSWSDTEGFDIARHDFYLRRELHLERMAIDKKPQLEEQYLLEERVELCFEAFARYFERQIAAIPRLTRALFKPKVVFQLKDRPDTHWVVDYDRREVYQADECPAEYSLRLVVPALVLKDCIYKKMFSVFSASKRLAVEVRRGCIRDFLIFFQVLDLYEYEYLPLRRLLTWRFVRVWSRRWREIATYLGLAVRLLSRRGDDPISELIPKLDEKPDEERDAESGDETPAAARRFGEAAWTH